MLLFGHLSFRECLGARARSYNTIQFIQVEREVVDQIFVAESLLERVRDSNECTNDDFVRIGGDMSIAALVLVTMLTGSSHAVRSDCIQLEATQQSTLSSDQRGQINSGQIKITIATGGGPYRPAKDTYRVGERIPIVITMTNTGTESVYVCESGTLYQDRLQLLKDDKPVNYQAITQSMMLEAARDKTCDDVNLPQQVLLRPNEATVVDWFVLAEGATSVDDDAWYEPLGPGKYRLSDRRRLNCCDGALIESNTINFAVVP